MSYQYSYLIGDLVLFAIWLVLFLWRRDVRKEMIILSLIFGFLGILVQFVYINDWWHPLTLTGTRIGIEDFIFGFCVAGIAAVIYEEIFKKKIRIRKKSKKKEIREDINFVFILILGCVLFFGSFYLLRLNSVLASLIGLGVPILLIWIKRMDLILDSLVSGILLMIASVPAFVIPELITPGVVKNFWFLENLSGVIILKVPLEDLIWFFLAGAYIGPLYEYWREGRLVRK